MPRQNRPLVRDGRLQAAKKKRTDRSYLRTGAAPADAQEPVADETLLEEAPADGALDAVAEEPAPAPPPMMAAQVQSSASAQTRVTGSMRAIQQQGVRKRREVDLDALAASDTRYALHEMRRIFVLTALIVVTLIVLAIVMR